VGVGVGVLVLATILITLFVIRHRRKLACSASDDAFNLGSPGMEEESVDQDPFNDKYICYDADFGIDGFY
jgi:hypothetical protein